MHLFPISRNRFHPRKVSRALVPEISLSHSPSRIPPLFYHLSCVNENHKTSNSCLLEVISRFSTDSVARLRHLAIHFNDRSNVNGLHKIRSSTLRRILILRGSFVIRLFQGMYAVAVGPYSGARCENRATLWRVRVPAAEKIMRQHYASDSVPSLTESVLLEILYELREGRVTDLSAKPKVILARKINFFLVTRLLRVSLDSRHQWILFERNSRSRSCFLFFIASPPTLLLEIFRRVPLPPRIFIHGNIRRVSYTQRTSNDDFHSPLFSFHLLDRNERIELAAFKKIVEIVRANKISSIVPRG